MTTSRASLTSKSHSRAFTLIEVLVVVAIIALLVSVLMPALRTAKETAKATVCLSNLKQQGNGIAAYSKDNKAYMPYGGRSRYPLMDGGYHNLTFDSKVDNVWLRQGNGLLFPKYSGNTVELFYCPSNTDVSIDGKRGKKLFMQLYNNPRPGMPGYLKAHDFPNAPIGAYAYALPLAEGKSPQDGAKQVFSDDSMTAWATPSNPGPSYSAFRSFLWDPNVQSNTTVNNWLGPISNPRTTLSPNGPRGAYPTQAILVDAYFSAYHGYHINGWNVLYSDYHCKRVGDPVRKIEKADDGSSPYTYSSSGGGPRIYVAWDYMSKNP